MQVIYHTLIINSYGPLIHDLPLTLADKSHGLRQESTDSVNHDDGTGTPKTKRKSRPLSEFGNLELAAADGAGPSGQDVESQPRQIPLVASPSEQPQARDFGSPAAYPPSPPAAVPPSPSPRSPGLKHRKSGGSVASVSTGHTMDSRGTSSSVREEFARDGDEPHEDENEDVGPTDFNHPATAADPPVIWIPKDELGLGDFEAHAIEKKEIKATTEGTRMDEKGRVEISTAPPDDRELEYS
jgi:calcium permeable stress-gated cation channel